MCCHYTILHRHEHYYITLLKRLQTFFRNNMLFFRSVGKIKGEFRLTIKTNNDIILFDANVTH